MAKIVNGRWSNSETLEPIDIESKTNLVNDIKRVGDFIGNRKVSNDTIEILMNIFNISTAKEQLILKILNMPEDQVNVLIKKI